MGDIPYTLRWARVKSEARGRPQRAAMVWIGVVRSAGSARSRQAPSRHCRMDPGGDRLAPLLFLEDAVQMADGDVVRGGDHGRRHLRIVQVLCSAGLEAAQQETHQVIDAVECRFRVGRVLGRERGGAVQGGTHGERESGGIPLDNLAAPLGVHDDPLEGLRGTASEAEQ